MPLAGGVAREVPGGTHVTLRARAPLYAAPRHPRLLALLAALAVRKVSRGREHSERRQRLRGIPGSHHLSICRHSATESLSTLWVSAERRAAVLQKTLQKTSMANTLLHHSES